jgi:hypothetical protein
VAFAVGLAGCGSINEKMSHTMSGMPGIGMRAEAPERSPEVLAYPAVHDMPPQRTTATLGGPEQQQMERELVAAREQQKAAANPAPPPAPATASRRPAARPAPAATPSPVPVSSSRTIY